MRHTMGRATTLTMMLAVMTMVAASAWAQPGSGRGGRGGGPGMRGQGDGPHWEARGHAGSCMEQLDLSDEQKEQLDTLRLEGRKEMVLLRGETASAKAKLQALMMDSKSARADIEAASRGLSELRNQQAEKRLAHRLDMRELLSEEQRASLEKCRGGRGHLGGGAMHGRQGMHGSHGSRGHGGHQRGCNVWMGDGRGGGDDI